MSMNSDIEILIARHQPATTAEICEHLETLGYGGGKSLGEFRDQVGKCITEMKGQGKITQRGFLWCAPPESDQEMASDIAELETVMTPNVVNHDAECREKPRKQTKPYTPNKIAGAYSYRGAMVIKLDRRANAKSVTLSPQDMAMLVAIHGNMT